MSEDKNDNGHKKLPAPMVAGAKPMAIVPQSFEDVWRIANLVIASGVAPRSLDTQEKVAIAVMYGLELGMTPMSAMQRIAVIGNRPTLWGDGALALVRASGQMIGMKEWLEGEGDRRIAVCRVHRKGDTEPVERDFGVWHAKQAGLWNKAGPWKDYPERMLQMRARAFALRDTFPDVLGGLYIAEELGGEETTRKAAPEPTRAPEPPAVEHKPAPPAEDVEYRDVPKEEEPPPPRRSAPPPPVENRRSAPPPPPVPEAGRGEREYRAEDRQDYQQATLLGDEDSPAGARDLEGYKAALNRATTMEALREIEESWSDDINGWGRKDRNVAEAAYELAEARIKGRR